MKTIRERAMKILDAPELDENGGPVLLESERVLRELVEEIARHMDAFDPVHGDRIRRRFLGAPTCPTCKRDLP